MKRLKNEPRLVLWAILQGALFLVCCQPSQTEALSVAEPPDTTAVSRVITGAEVWLRDSSSHWLGKRIALAANPTSRVGQAHLADALRDSGILLACIFAPEHGFRGEAAAGDAVSSGVDSATGAPVISLYGARKKPTPADLKGIDLVLFDMQDVGSRHYTYASTLALIVEACAESGVPVCILDRPNPNGFVTDGPVLEPAHQSFIGRFPVPVAHGLTLGELMRMAAGEGWLDTQAKPDLRISWCEGYHRQMAWHATGLPWTPPSPNLPTPYAAWVYLAACWLEGTSASEGRGTDSAFLWSGAPWHRPAAFGFGGLQADTVSFVPRNLPGKASAPKHESARCYGYRLSGYGESRDLFLTGLTLLRRYSLGAPGGYWNKNFARWAGSDQLALQLKGQLRVEAIYEGWQPAITAFREARKPYLYYPD